MDTRDACATRFGSKELIDPHQGRKVFQQIEKKARHQLAKYSKPFPAASARSAPISSSPAPQPNAYRSPPGLKYRPRNRATGYFSAFFATFCATASDRSISNTFASAIT